MVKDRFGLLIDGEEVESAGGETFTTDDPATGEVTATVQLAGERDVDRAVEAARRTVDGDWAQVAPRERSRILARAAVLIDERGDELAEAETLDTGKPISQARADVEAARQYLEFYGGTADKIHGETIPVDPGYLDYTRREPYGVSAIIIPWNYPLQIFGRSVGAALAAGNAAVIKPSVETPLTALLVADILDEAGLPAGAINVIPGRGSTAGDALIHHRDIDHITFTGSTETGRLILQAAAQHIVPTTVELGGKSPNAVFGDADLEAAVPGVLNAIYQHAGQTCSAGSRLLVQSEVRDEVVAALKERTEAMTIGPGLEDPDMGALVTQQQLDTVAEYVGAGQQEGARLVTGGERPEGPALDGGRFYRPTIFDGVDPDGVLAQEEIFGPVLSVMSFDTAEEALALANHSQYGLVAGIWTQDIDIAHWFADRVEAGQVFINSYGAGGGVQLPFGGYKDSGYGREKGVEALYHYTQLKNVLVRARPPGAGDGPRS